MAHIIIRDLGPIIDVEFDLNKVNVIIGPQSSGKSTIDKIACYCSWVEKKASQDQSFDFFTKDGTFLRELIRFHKIDGYLKPSSYIHYTSKVIDIEYSHRAEDLKMSWVDIYAFQNSKIAYIPAERNLVAAIPNWFEVKLPDNNTLNYMKDWGESRQIHTKETPFTISSIGASYYYEGGNDYVKVKSNKPLLLTNTSSGYQSLIPLTVLFHYLTEWIYKNASPKSVENNSKLSELNNKLANDLLWDKVKDYVDIKNVEEIIDKLVKAEHSSKLGIVRDNWMNIRANFLEYKCSKLFIEEPEQNLFPETQMALVYDIFESLNRANKPHQLFITTHSPYVLYAINNCILGGLLKDQIPTEVLSTLQCQNSFINPKYVSVWEIKDGRFNPYKNSHTIQDEDGLIRKNYFDGIMKSLMRDFNSMLNFYD